MVEVNWTLQALDDLDATADYIAHNSPAYASSLVAKAFAATERLSRFPLIGRIVPEFQRKDIRELIIDRRFRLIYQVKAEDQV